MLNKIARTLARKSVTAIFKPRKFLSPDVPLAHDIGHDRWHWFLQREFDKPGNEILEVGSRNVTGSNLKSIFPQASHTGVDIHPGENVDVVGDAHQLSSLFPGKKFDLIVSSSVFEHLAMPWIVSLEIIRMLKPGGHVFIETHYSFNSHERPWHFFQFSELGLKVLFPRAFGIECVDAGVSNPILGFFSPLASEYLRLKPVAGLYCHSSFLGKKVEEVENLDWNALTCEQVVNGTIYPPGGGPGQPQ